MATEIPHLSTRCPVCGDSASMPPVSPAFLCAKSIFFGTDRRNDIYGVAHLCPNAECVGTTIAYYSRHHSQGGQTIWTYLAHVPRYREYQASESIPERPRTILQDANDARGQPVACAATAVRAVEAMLADKGYSTRRDSLEKRINKAVIDGLLPKTMGQWAHHVRDIGNETHTDDDDSPLPTKGEANDALLFANMLAEYLYVLPARFPEKLADADADAVAPPSGAT